MILFWAYLAGALTLVNPCVLPLVPIVLTAALQGSRAGPIALAAGLTASFAAVGVGITAFGHLAGISAEGINRLAAIVMIVFGAVLLVPRAQGLLSALSAPLARGADGRIAQVAGTGASSQFAIGLLLGAVWSPCVGPTLGGAIGLAASGESLAQATLTMLAFGAGVSSVLLALAYGSREVIRARRERLARWMPWAKPAMGIALLVVGVAILSRVDRAIEAWLLDRMPAWLQALSISV